MLVRRSRSSYTFTARRRTFILIPAAVATALAASHSASAATPLTGEVLGGTGTTANTTYSQCRGALGASASFAVSGNATVNGSAGPYPGTFVASGRAWASGRQQFGFTYASETATFAITSDTTTITGTLKPSKSFAHVDYGCSSNLSGLASLASAGCQSATRRSSTAKPTKELGSRTVVSIRASLPIRWPPWARQRSIAASSSSRCTRTRQASQRTRAGATTARLRGGTTVRAGFRPRTIFRLWVGRRENTQ